MRRKHVGARRTRVCDRFGIDAEATWTPVPHALRKLAKDRGLGLAAYVLLIEILDTYQPVFGSMMPFSANAAAAMAPMSRTSVRKALVEIEAAGLVRVESLAGNRVLLHVEPLLLALRVACATFRRTQHLPLLTHRGGLGTRAPRGVAPVRQGLGTRAPSAGSTDVGDEQQDARATEHEHVAKIRAQLAKRASG